MNKYGIPGLRNPEIMKLLDFDVNNEIGILFDQSEAETIYIYIKLLYLSGNNLFHKNNPEMLNGRLIILPSLSKCLDYLFT